jgi:5-methylcytosine-specific restriction endonuclease McrA
MSYFRLRNRRRLKMKTFLSIALNEYKPNQHKRRKLLRKTAINYYYLARENVPGLWSMMYNDTPYGRKLYDAITGYVAAVSTRCAYCQDKVFHNANLNIDHILPASIYPQYTFSLRNLVATCVTCNAIKKDTDYFELPNSGRSYPKSTNAWNCFHPAHHLYENHIDKFVMQTNHINIRAFIGKGPTGVKICTELLSKVSEFETKAFANSVVANAIENLGNYIAKFPASKSQSLSNLLQLMANNI